MSSNSNCGPPQPSLSDPHDLAQVKQAINELDAARGEFCAWLRSVSKQHLASRPAPKRWSAMEHVRHLLMAEETYTDLWIARNGRPLSEIGLPPSFLKDRAAYRHAGRTLCDDLEQVLAAWTDVHARTHQFLAGASPADLKQDTSDVDLGQGTVGNVLKTLVDHDVDHMAKARRAVAASEAADNATNTSESP